MNAIKITTNNESKIAAVVKDVQKTSRVREIDASDIYDHIEYLESKLVKKLLKKDWVGLVIHCDPNAQSFPGAYKGIPESTRFTVERRKTGWFLNSVSRRHCGTRSISCDFSQRANQLATFASNNF